jgi:AraC-like DNA-binding protein
MQQNGNTPAEAIAAGAVGLHAWVRPEWLEPVMGAAQAIAGRVLLVGPDDTEAMLVAFVASLPQPASPIETLLLRGVLSEVAGRCGQAIHTRWHRGRSLSTCPFMLAASYAMWDAPSDDPTQAFLVWIDRFFRAFVHAHPPSASAKTAQLLRADYRRTWDLATLARRVAMTPSKLRRDFHRQFDRSPLAYQRAVRVAEAMRQMPAGKIDAIALHVGYRSRKNLNRAFENVTGITPSAFRALSIDDTAALVASIRLRGHRFSDLSSREVLRPRPDEPF